MIAPIAVRAKFFSRFHRIPWNHRSIISKKHAVVRFFNKNFSKSLAVSLCTKNDNQIKKIRPTDIVILRIYQFIRLIHDSPMSFVSWTSLKLIKKWTNMMKIINHGIILLRWLSKKSLNFFINKKHTKIKCVLQVRRGARYHRKRILDCRFFDGVLQLRRILLCDWIASFLAMTDTFLSSARGW
jgi:hypothetical protein